MNFTIAQQEEIKNLVTKRFKQNKITKWHLLMLNYWVHMTVMLVFLGGGIIFIALGLNFIKSSVGETSLRYFFIALGAVFIIFYLACGAIWKDARQRINKILTIDVTDLMASHLITNKYKTLKYKGTTVGSVNCNTINTIFKDFAQRGDSPQYQKCWNINLYHPDFLLDFGTLLTSKVVRDNRGNQVRIYSALNYVGFKLGDTELTTFLRPEHKLFGSKKMNKEETEKGLESTEFENMFKIDYTTPIPLRKFFQPRIMVNILDFITNQADGKKVKAPKIWISRDEIIVEFSHKTIKGETSYDQILNQLSPALSIDKTCAKVMAKIDKDIETLNSNLEWGKIFDLPRYKLAKSPKAPAKNTTTSSPNTQKTVIDSLIVGS